jgi:outer membrane protein assembly factor BamD (BamD/ComL family)
MKKSFMFAVLLITAVLVSAPAVVAQGNVKSGPEPTTVRDSELEKDSLHNLEVARNYFNLKKAYVAALRRLEEVVASNPTFSKMDEVLFLAGESSKFLAENKGKQSASQYVTLDDNGTKRSPTPEEFKEMARGFLIRVVNDFPQSKYHKQAQMDLEMLGEPAAKP